MRKSLFVSMLLFVLASACAPKPTPAPTPTPTPVGAVSPAVLLVDEYYRTVNDAQSQDEFAKPWDLLSNKEQCSPRRRCDMSYFQDYWWKWKVHYQLYDCGANRVIAEEIRYPRTEAQPDASATPQYWEYQVIQSPEGYMIDNSSLSESPTSECVLAIDQSVNP